MNNTINPQSNTNFQGRIDRQSKRIAKNIGNNVLNSLINKANELHEDTILTLNQIDSKYFISAYNPYLPSGKVKVLSKITSDKLPESISQLDAKAIDESIVDSTISTLKKSARASQSSSEYKGLKKDAKRLLKLERELGLHKTFWTDVKNTRNKAIKKRDKYWADFDAKHRDNKARNLY